MSQHEPTSNVCSAAELVAAAQAAREFAHAPYSKFKVGAVVECADGRQFTGCNVENSSYGLSLCAERVALFKAVSEGARDFTRLAVVADAFAPVRPCGACRQVMADLLPPEAEVIMANQHGEIEIMTISALLPAPFDRSML